MTFSKMIGIAALGLTLAAPVAQAQAPGKPDKVDKESRKEMRDEKRSRAERQIEDAEALAQRERSDAAAERRRKDLEDRAGRRNGERHDDDDSDSEDSDDGAKTDEIAGDVEKRSAARGNERAQDMRARRDERKEIMEDYREGRSDQEGVRDPDADPEKQSDEQKQDKKPWWKFWGD